MITNIEIARLLRQIAAAYTILGESRFKIIAYDNAATTVEHETSELQDLWEQDRLKDIPGIGAAISTHLIDLFKHGKSRHFESILKKVNPAVFPLLEVPGIGPKKAERLVRELQLKNDKTVISDLEKAAKAHRIAQIESFGAKSESEILQSIERYKHGAIKEKRMVLPVADQMAQDLISYLEKTLGDKARRIDPLGSLRRQVATIGDLDIAISTHDPETAIEAFCGYPEIAHIEEKGPNKATILLKAGRTVDLRVSTPEAYGAMLQYFTGSKYHNIKLRSYAIKKHLSLSEYGIKKGKQILEFNSEEKFYDFLGMDYIPPELREDTGEVEAALEHKLPDLLKLSDIKGDFHLHSSFGQETSHDSGIDPVPEIQRVAMILGYEYFACSDHNPSQKHSKEQIITEMKRRNKYFEQLNKSNKSVRVINMLEVDILPDGTLPVPNDGLDLLDGCLVSIHSSFNLSKEKMTERILSGLANPVARIFAHPTGRLLNNRDSYELDWDKIFRFCIEHDKALEINAFPNRLDLPDTVVKEAVQKGVMLSMGSDAHVKEDLRMMKYGVSVARRGWVQKQNIVNSLGCHEAIGWIHKRS